MGFFGIFDNHPVKFPFMLEGYFFFIAINFGYVLSRPLFPDIKS